MRLLELEHTFSGIIIAYHIHVSALQLTCAHAPNFCGFLDLSSRRQGSAQPASGMAQLPDVKFSDIMYADCIQMRV